MQLVLGADVVVVVVVVAPEHATVVQMPDPAELQTHMLQSLV